MNEISGASGDPIFLRGFSRSGGTLLTTILDSHPELSMSYEIYHHLLNYDDNTPKALKRLAKRLRRGAAKDVLKSIECKGLLTFVNRLPRGGLDQEDFVSLLLEHVSEGFGFRSSGEQLRFMERCCRLKMLRSGKSIWGVKSMNRFDDYYELWPEAFHLNIVRDIRDVVASQLKLGTFSGSPSSIAIGWKQTNEFFYDFLEKPKVNGMIVKYEDLVTNKEVTIGKIMAFLNLPVVPEVLAHEERELTIFSASHLSLSQVSQPVSNSKVGRWKSDLTEGQAQEAVEAAGEVFSKLGYE